MYKDPSDNNKQRINKTNENYMSLRFMHYRNSSINKTNKNLILYYLKSLNIFMLWNIKLNKSKSDKNFMNFNANHICSYSVINMKFLGPNQAFWEASIYAKFIKNIKKVRRLF